MSKCPICLYDIDKDEYCRLNCDHLICKGCLEKLVKYETKCPLCLAVFEEYCLIQGEKRSQISVTPRKRSELSQGDSFASLDHTHFFYETRGLIQRVENVLFHTSVFATQHKNVDTAPIAALLGSLKREFLRFRDLFRDFEEFDAVDVLNNFEPLVSELDAIEQALKSSNDFNALAKRLKDSSEQRKLYAVDDIYSEEDYDSHEEYFYEKGEEYIYYSDDYHFDGQNARSERKPWGRR